MRSRKVAPFRLLRLQFANARTAETLHQYLYFGHRFGVEIYFTSALYSLRLSCWHFAHMLRSVFLSFFRDPYRHLWSLRNCTTAARSPLQSDIRLLVVQRIGARQEHRHRCCRYGNRHRICRHLFLRAASSILLKGQASKASSSPLLSVVAQASQRANNLPVCQGYFILKRDLSKSSPCPAIR